MAHCADPERMQSRETGEQPMRRREGSALHNPSIQVISSLRARMRYGGSEHCKCAFKLRCCGISKTVAEAFGQSPDVTLETRYSLRFVGHAEALLKRTADTL
jgi:hypothetical protein